MKQIIILGLVSLLAFSSFKEKNGVTLTFNIQNFDPALLQIRNAFGAMDWVENLKTKDGKFTITLPIDKPSMISFWYSSNVKQIFLYPNQSLNIAFDANNFTNTFDYGGSLAKENIILDSVLNHLMKVNYKHLNSQHVDVVFSYIDSAMNANNLYFEKLAKGRQTTRAFIEFTKASILYRCASLKLSVLERQKGNKNIEHYSFLKDLTIESDNYLDIGSYQWFLYSYISMETGKRFEKLDSIQKLYPDSNFNERLKVIANLKNQKVREFSLTDAINSLLQEGSTKSFDKYYDYFKKNNSNPTYSGLIKQEYEKKQLLAPGRPAPQFTLTDVNDNKVSLSDFKGKYVLIDFWSTLCPNSARELPHYLKLYSDYRDENIAFVSISVNVDENVWKTYVKEKKNVGTSLRAENYFWSEVCKEYQVIALPTFVIIDKDGNIVDPMAAKPSSMEIRETLDRLLKSK